jgi:DNA repair protein RecN (Recombination protein N)
MLRELRIRDLALIAHAELSFQPGFVVVSGETGAGKSLLLSAIDLLSGRKSDGSIVRHGADSAEIRGRFEIRDAVIRSTIESILGCPDAAGTVEIVRRVDSTNGRSVSTVNGKAVPLKKLETLGSLLIDHVGQHQTRGLSDEATRTAMLDRYGGLDADCERYRHSRFAYEAARKSRLEAAANLAADQAERERIQLDLEELDRLSPVVGESQSLMTEAKMLARADEIRRVTSSAYHAISESETAIYDHIAKIVRKLAPIANLSKELTAAHETISQLLSDLDDVAAHLADAGEAAQADPQRSDAIEKRLAEYRRLSKRFSVPEDELPRTRLDLRHRLDTLEARHRGLTSDSALPDLWKACETNAKMLVKGRERAAMALSADICARLVKLGMESAELRIEVVSTTLPEFSDDLPAAPENPASVRFMFRPNPGEPASPLERIASGGELSRLMLACMSCLADSSGTSTVILDEIDSGVGGRLGTEIGAAIADLARHHQVICITHLPQIASQADQHLLVRKQGDNGRTVSSAVDLNSKELRVEELAAMLRGKKADANTRIEAEAMLNHEGRETEADSSRNGKANPKSKPQRTSR